MSLTKNTDPQILQDALTYLERYVRMESRSNPDCPDSPSNPAILELARAVQQDLEALGLEAELTEEGYLYASCPGNAPASEGGKVLGLISHLDTSPEMSGENVQPRRVLYSGEPIVLNEGAPSAQAITLDETRFPHLRNLRGEELIVTDGSTLLGADDKAGCAAILALLKYFKDHPEVQHGEIRVAFTPGEEIGRGVEFFDLEKFGAEVAYTVDGGPLGELESENFNAATAFVTVHGQNVHTGSAKGKMKNALTMAADFVLAMPPEETPENTEGYEGFFHLLEMHGSVDEARLKYLIRDFDLRDFEARKEMMYALTEMMNDNYNDRIFEIAIEDSYYNMKEKLEDHPELLDYAREAMEACGVTPIEDPLRGGTDGATLSHRGLPCPNLFTGGDNFHGRYEYLVVSSFGKLLEVLLELVPKFL